MGACVCRMNPDNETMSVSSASISRPPSAGIALGASRKNRPLCHETIRWRSDVPLTEGQLRSKRDEFWDTAPAFDGRKEIWDALRAATNAAEGLDFQMAQAILDGANVSVPNGYLTECYDELGTQYKVPIYCLSYPINIVKEENGRDSPAEYSEPVDGGTEIFLKLRISSSMTDVKLPVYSKDTVGQCKKKLQATEGVDACCQRWFYSGKLLGDKVPIDECSIHQGYVVQVIINTEHYNHDNSTSTVHMSLAS
ncbi:GL21661 [Drosophila persimilis]|uniref:Ubiquitin domain-containing protein 1 n=2 Tax=pseudoobscura subgroup TaxID=32358 RepID=A0A6I8UQV2_DROPS|nr:ubiquitin domain-containing protein 1 [Drosophila pseudoobscura]XP_002017185.1 ubiquitin domain-containing protein 1 [Drosophila persimilis]XP_017144194.1 ubiquitin domain-containing protein 1 [Drosophila miranda]EDW34285.1 GL21661 [Drosophila persimilis]